MYCVFNVTTTSDADSGHPFGWPLESNYGYFCDQRDKGLYMLSSGFLNVVAIVAVYLSIVLYFGPKMMQNRKPLERALKLVDNGRSFFNCKGVELDMAHVDEIATITELFLLSRLADFLDTICNYCGKSQTAALVGSLMSAVIFLGLFYSFYQKAYVQKPASATKLTTSNGQPMGTTTSCAQQAAREIMNNKRNASHKKAE